MTPVQTNSLYQIHERKTTCRHTSVPRGKESVDEGVSMTTWEGMSDVWVAAGLELLGDGERDIDDEMG